MLNFEYNLTEEFTMLTLIEVKLTLVSAVEGDALPEFLATFQISRSSSTTKWGAERNTLRITGNVNTQAVLNVPKFIEVAEAFRQKLVALGGSGEAHPNVAAMAKEAASEKGHEAQVVRNDQLGHLHF